MKISRFVPSLLLVAGTVGTVLIAQTPARPGGGAPTTTTAPATAPATTTAATTSTSNVQQTLQEILEEPTTADTYRYDPQGRRDPFQSLIGPTPRVQPGQRPPGVPGFLIDEMKLQGVVKTSSGLVAMV